MLVKSISSTVFGSAVAGFGFSLGKDLYKSGKGKDDTRPFIIVFVLAVLALYLTYMSGLWFSRNYRSIFKSIVVKAIALSIAAAIFVFWYTYFFKFRGDGTLELVPVEELVLNWKFWIPFVVFSLGLIVGFTQRSKRKYAWEAEEYNAAFLSSNGFSEVDGFIVDRKNQRYRIEETTSGYIKLFALNRRSIRGFLRLDDTGKITSWSGPVKV